MFSNCLRIIFTRSARCEDLGWLLPVYARVPNVLIAPSRFPVQSLIMHARASSWTLRISKVNRVNSLPRLEFRVIHTSFRFRVSVDFR